MSVLPLIFSPCSLYSQLLLLWYKKHLMQVWFCTPNRKYSMEQVTYPLVIGIDDTCNTKVIHGPVCVSPFRFWFWQMFFFIQLCFHQCGIQLNIEFIFWVAGKIITHAEKNPTNMMYSCSVKISIGHTEDSDLSGKTHICTRWVQIIIPTGMVPRRSY